MLNPGNSCADLPVKNEVSAQPFRSMYRASYELQQRLGAAGAILPAQVDMSTRISRLAYWSYCINDEFLELFEWVQGLNPERLKELHMEFVDVLCFINNVGMTLSVSVEEMDRHTAGISWYTFDVSRGLDVYNLIKHEIASRSKFHQILKWLPWKTWKQYSDCYEVHALEKARQAYFQYYRFTLNIAGIIGLNKDMLYNIYQAKMLENHARQDRKY